MDQLNHDHLHGFSADDTSGQRIATRDSLLLTATLRAAGREAVTVRVRNLSAGGLMAEHPAPIMPGTPVEVEVRGIGKLGGRIAWSAEGRVGIAFEREIDPMMARKPVGPTKPAAAGAVQPPLSRRCAQPIS